MIIRKRTAEYKNTQPIEARIGVSVQSRLYDNLHNIEKPELTIDMISALEHIDTFLETKGSTILTEIHHKNGKTYYGRVFNTDNGMLMLQTINTQPPYGSITNYISPGEILGIKIFHHIEIDNSAENLIKVLLENTSIY